MKKTAVILMIIMQSNCLFGQTKKNKFPIGSWIGEIEIGDSNPRLVFHITPANIGTFSGVVDSPDKGVKDIPLSRVHVVLDSAVFEVSSAHASFKGIFSAQKNTIEGIWKQGESTYPLTLTSTSDTIFYAKEKTVSYKIQKTTQHFEFYSSDSDLSVLDELANMLEGNYTRVTDKLQTQFTEKIQVFIYPDIKAFHDAIYMPNAQDWVVGAAGINELMMVSPLNPGNEHTYASLMKAIVHELAHTAVLNIREQGLAGLPKWLNEGYAFYEAHQMTDNWRKSIKETFSNDHPPSWAQLDNANTADFGDMDGYGLSVTIIEFLVNTYGFDKLRQLILAPEHIEAIYGQYIIDLEKQWVQYLRKE